MTQLQVENDDGNLVPNPLFSDLQGTGTPPRPQAYVYLAGIIGVPWQDLATEDTLAAPEQLRLMSASELRAKDRWRVILGDPELGERPSDPFMIETPDDRTTLSSVPQTNPITNTPLVPSDSTNPLASPINGHEYLNVVPNRDDLQYACIFRLAEPKDCTQVGSRGCDCSAGGAGTGAGPEVKNKPLCQSPDGGTIGTTQYFAKAYPATRELQVLKQLGEQVAGVDNAIVASICPKVIDRAKPSFGYNPAIDAIVERLKEHL